jgi:plastocyanin
MRAIRAALIAAVAALVVAALARAAGGPNQAPVQPPIPVTANGDIFGQLLNPNDLNFAPTTVTAHVGQVVRWTNTDPLVPHTVTEVHGLFDLAGDYGQTPLNPAGFAPGTSVQRVFAAGTYLYFCRVHPQYMHGVVAVPVALVLAPAPASATASVARAHHRGGKRRQAHRPQTVSTSSAMVAATWATSPPAGRQVFDVRYRSGDDPWQSLETGTNALGATFAAGRSGTTWHVEARLRSARDASAASSWSPDATLTVS